MTTKNLLIFILMLVGLTGAQARVHKHKKVHAAPAPVMYQTDEVTELSAKEIECLTKNIYYEARGESYEGKLAVAQVTMNRLKSEDWGPSVCKVVYAPFQFEWTRNSKIRRQKFRSEEWFTSLQVSYDYAEGRRVKPLEEATHFYANSIKKPKWAKKLYRIQRVGHHIFYK